MKIFFKYILGLLIPMLMASVNELSAQIKVPDTKLLGTWELVQVSYEAYHMQLGTLLKSKTITGKDMKAIPGGGLIEQLEFLSDFCMVKFHLSMDRWKYSCPENGRLLIQTYPVNKEAKQSQEPLFEGPYALLPGDTLALGSMTNNYMDPRDGVPMKIVYQCKFKKK
ncbi:hypothetical protein CLV59_109254 [Chitinophaga dinghuensis]|uniref:Lipocalin-like protein n=1 Tax=Chitinophaga dinghuensis TaxID=1539050 RepID=A0A327VLK7_9BACT|nr:hypothetical protein [Chitinophaga dinghuensis]RAJ75640.1 hypothetical protein CLV59_109254 [Chitinophaga dinghuensis]